MHLICMHLNLLARLFGAKSPAESLGLDYMHDPQRDSLQDSFFLRGYLKKYPKIQSFKQEIWFMNPGFSVYIFKFSTTLTKSRVTCPEVFFYPGQKKWNKKKMLYFVGVERDASKTVVPEVKRIRTPEGSKEMVEEGYSV